MPCLCWLIVVAQVLKRFTLQLWTEICGLNSKLVLLNSPLLSFSPIFNTINCASFLVPLLQNIHFSGGKHLKQVRNFVKILKGRVERIDDHQKKVWLYTPMMGFPGEYIYTTKRYFKDIIVFPIWDICVTVDSPYRIALKQVCFQMLFLDNSLYQNKLGFT